MTIIKNVSHQTIYRDPERTRCENQVVIKQLLNGEVVAVFNEGTISISP